MDSNNKEKILFNNYDINYGSTGITHQELWDLCSDSEDPST